MDTSFPILARYLPAEMFSAWRDSKSLVADVRYVVHNYEQRLRQRSMAIAGLALMLFVGLWGFMFSLHPSAPVATFFFSAIIIATFLPMLSTICPKGHWPSIMKDLHCALTDKPLDLLRLVQHKPFDSARTVTAARLEELATHLCAAERQFRQACHNERPSEKHIIQIGLELQCQRAAYERSVRIAEAFGLVEVNTYDLEPAT